MGNTRVESGNLPALRDTLATRFSASELRTLAFDLGIDYEALPHQNKSDLARELLQSVVNRRELPKLLAYIRNARPDIRLDVGALSGSGVGYVSAPAASALPAVPQELWSRDLGAPVNGLASVWGKLCLLSGLEPPPFDRNGLLRAIRANDGDVVWEKHFISSSLAGLSSSAGLIVVGLNSATESGGESAAVAIDAAGRIVWRCQPHVRVLSAPVVVDGIVIATGDGRELILMDLNQGTLLSRIPLPVSVASAAAPAVASDVAYIPCRAPMLLAVGLDGLVRWQFSGAALGGAWLHNEPLAVGGLVLAAASTGVLVAVDATAGRWAWRCVLDSRGRAVSPPATDGATVYVGSQDGLHAVRLEDGQRLWKFPTSAGIEAAPVISEGRVYVACRDHRLYALEAVSGALIWEHTLASSLRLSPLLLAGGDEGPYAVVADRTGRLTAISYPVDAQAHEAAGRWRKAALAWEAAGDPARAASAWERHARKLEGEGAPQGTCGEAWGAAARAREVAGELPQAVQCRIEEARCLSLPLIGIDVETGAHGLVLGTWSRLKFAVRNAGFGAARALTVQVTGRQFEGQITQPQEIPLLSAGSSRDQVLDVKPLDAGDSVPLRVEVGYLDDKGQSHTLETTIYIPVASQVEQGKAGAVFHVLGPRSEATPYVDVEIRLGAGPSGYTVEVTLDRSEVFLGGALPVDAIEWRTSGDLRADGRRLFEAIVQSREIRDAWVLARSRARSRSVDCRVRLRIDPDAPALHAIPWESMHDGDTMLAAHRGTPFSRYLATSEPAGEEVRSRPVRVLAAIANPKDLAERFSLTPLRVDLERYLLAKAFAQLDPAAVALSFLPPPITLARLSQALRSDYQVIHFVGHGRFSRLSQQTELLMEDPEGYARPVSERDLCAMLARRPTRPHLMYLSACQGGTRSELHPFVGLAPRLVQVGVPAVVAMQGDISLQVAQVVAGAFYGALAAHGYVDRALNEARDAVLSRGLPGAENPVLYMHLDSGRLW